MNDKNVVKMLVINDKHYIRKEDFFKVVRNFKKENKKLRKENEQLIKLVKDMRANKVGCCAGCKYENENWEISENICLGCDYSDNWTWVMEPDIFFE